MLSGVIEEGLKAVKPEFLTDVILVLLFLVLISAIYYKRKNEHTGFTNYAPTLLTSFGIFGTFIGIVAGLLHFNTSDIEGSIGPLLEGLKTAFVTSIFGILLSILYKLVDSYIEQKNSSEGEYRKDNVDASDIYEVMSQQLAISSEVKVAIEKGDGNNTSSITQLKEKMEEFINTGKERESNFAEFQERLWNKLDNFAELMSESATEQVIVALNSVIKDFNNQLKEQFGKNFSDLNEAVFKLVEWQENYKIQLADMQEKYALGVQVISETEASVSKITEHTSSIPENMNSLKTVIEVNQHQIKELDKHLDAFVQVRDAAVASVPEIKEKIDSAIEGVKQANDLLAEGITTSAEKIENVISQSADQYIESVDQTRAALTESAQTTANASDEIKEQFSIVLEDINGQMRVLIEELKSGSLEVGASLKNAGNNLLQDTTEFSQYYNKELNQIRDQLAITVEELTKLHRQEVEKLFGGIEQSMEQTLLKNNDTISTSMKMIDQSMGEELERVIQQLGSNLGAVTEKFASDYTRLIKVMENVLTQQPISRVAQ
ncbi:MotA/TolQ/ExbB proton channel family protein [Endozoicomonas sp. SM1973]|uniref:MotA/TolQ/ExbB proton channel family protein n=1 Tax=Spartinivicinus marinus TaxID=2994442 RepID=A0A853IKC9_9GAMM|nr:MotA/TolQ/ExbB proton channel family protein [Spartinivicinus marinus]MCX4030332.1 MotA/TolQ/ExbB proton channel family protein [Spartinivicinus marinus]MCX4030512.1 MotA/TolQ/ExbB proton channel family protein [Spartinivicinus marinus]NYZ69535.1 MotA/TolQ/ExbB proton channel family protein [Spartinivicinus marinus]